MSTQGSDPDDDLPADLETEVREVAAEEVQQQLAAIETTDRNGDHFSVADLVDVGLTRRQAIVAMGLAVISGATLTEAAIQAMSGTAEAATGTGEVGTAANPLATVYANDLGTDSEPVQTATISELSTTQVEETTVSASPSSSYTVDLTQGTVWDVTMTGDTTFSFTGASDAAGTNSFTLVLRQDSTGGRSPTWPSSVAWAGGSAPSVSTGSNAVDLLTFTTPDQGTTWFAALAGKGFT